MPGVAAFPVGDITFLSLLFNFYGYYLPIFLYNLNHSIQWIGTLGISELQIWNGFQIFNSYIWVMVYY